MSDTPRTDAARLDEHDPAHAIAIECGRMERELNEAKIGAARYEYLRKLNPREFSNLSLECLHMDLNFDAEVDRRRIQS